MGSTWLALASLGVVALAVPGVPGAATLDLVGKYAGTYLIAGTSVPEPLQLEIEKQRGRRLRVSVFAENEPEFMGHGRLARDASAVHVAAHGTGRRHLVLMAGVAEGGTALDGTFRLTRPGRPPAGGTFAVSR